MEIQGRIKATYPTQNVSASFSKRDVVITTEEQYPQDILIQFVQDKCSALDSYQIGEQVKVSINLRGREWTNPQGEVKYFNTIQGWRIERSAPTQIVQSESQQQGIKHFPPSDSNIEEENDDLPF